MFFVVETQLFKKFFWAIAAEDDQGLVIHRSGFGPFAKVTNKDEHPFKHTSIPEINNAVAAYQDGNSDLIRKFRIKHEGTGFAKSVWREISKVLHGKTISYGELAKRVGNPNAFRAVGTACGKNPVPIFVPCHRIVPASGGVGQYAFGSEIKKLLLQHELDTLQTQKSTLPK